MENSKKISLTLSIYNCENPPKRIDLNMTGKIPCILLYLIFLGNKLFKGFIEKDLTKGSAGFEKIQIKEVTSHFRNGWIFLMIHPTYLPIQTQTC